MLISAFNLRYLSTTELAELTGHMICTYPDKLVLQKKKIKNKKSWTKLKNYLLVG